MKIALVHDYLIQDGGAERVLHTMHSIWKDAPIHVLFYRKERFPQFSSAKIIPSWLNNIPGVHRSYRWTLPLMPLATEHYDLSDYDIVISSTSAFAKGIITDPKTFHISYCHTPTRYLWSDTHEYIKNLRTPLPFRGFIHLLIHKLRQWDKFSADRVDLFIANSKEVQGRIKKYYDKESRVLYPSIDIASFAPKHKKEEFYITGGRLVPYKRFDLVIDTFNRLGKKLVIFGEGPELSRLQKKAKENISFVGKISDEEKATLLAKAKAFIHPQEEDFGITPIESLASGTPVIAYAKGGALETVTEGKTGLFFYKQNWHALYNAVIAFEQTTISSDVCIASSAAFDHSYFIQELVQIVKESYEASRHKTLR